ncbi:MFS transporter [Pleurocapsales cyanobacterium LEGE 06147]|nr:MFS transporter [Pleurocapsales cyanobacterium LEGE 06147]
MRTFIIIWFGQLVSTIGSEMTGFALILWAWEQTGSATALALVGFFSQLPRIPIALVAGLIVDRLNRKHLMILGCVGWYSLSSDWTGWDFFYRPSYLYCGDRRLPATFLNRHHKPKPNWKPYFPNLPWAFGKYGDSPACDRSC